MRTPATLPLRRSVQPPHRRRRRVHGGARRTTAAYANLLGPALEFLFTGQVKALDAPEPPSSVDFEARSRRSIAARCRGAAVRDRGRRRDEGLPRAVLHYGDGEPAHRRGPPARALRQDAVVLARLLHAPQQRRPGSRVAGDVWAVDAAVTNAIRLRPRRAHPRRHARELLHPRLEDVARRLRGGAAHAWPVLRLTKRLKTLTSKAARTPRPHRDDPGGARRRAGHPGVRDGAGGSRDGSPRRSRYLRVMESSVRAVSSPLMR